MSRGPKFPGIIDHVVNRHGAWVTQSSRDTARHDANTVLEALLAEHGVDGAVRAMLNQGFVNPVETVIRPLYDEAMRRRLLRRKSRTDRSTP